jgi:hypothetical protein
LRGGFFEGFLALRGEGRSSSLPFSSSCSESCGGESSSELEEDEESLLLLLLLLSLLPLPPPPSPKLRLAFEMAF